MRFSRWINKGYCFASGIVPKVRCSSRSRRLPARRDRRAFRPCLEGLEGRLAPAVLPPAGLVSWYRAEGNANDFTGGNNGVLMNGATFTIGEVGQAFSLDGVDDNVTFPTTSFADIPTLEMWIRTTIPNQSIIDSGPIFGSWRIGIDSSGHAEYAHFRNGTGGFVTITSTTVVADGQNHHLVAETDQAAKTIRLFVDGNLEASYTETDPSFTSWAFAAPGDAKLGKCDTPGLPLSFYSGAVDELSLYTRVLSNSEIQGLFNAGTDGKATIVVNTVADTVDADPSITSLREAILASNASVGDRDVIGFDIPSAGVQTISPTSALPTITDPVVIDGYTQPGASVNTDPNGFNGTLLIEISGASNTDSANGLDIAAGGSTVRGLVINGFHGPLSDDRQDSGILLETLGGNVIVGNFLGTDPTGTAARPNGNVGIFVASPNNTIGGTSPADRNVISGNAPFDGVFVSPANGVGDASGNVIQGNFIGTQADGVSPLGNARDGVIFVHGAHDNILGGTSAGAGNVIAFNSAGVIDASGNFGLPDALRNSILGNSIFSNTGLGIDLGDDGLTNNDVLPGDPDPGPNNLQNFPVLTSAVTTSGSTTITGTLNSTPGATFRIEFFANDAADPSGNGEGQIFLGAITTDTTNANGDVSFTATLPVSVSLSQFVTATATDPAGNTSEFSGAVPVTTGTNTAPIITALDGPTFGVVGQQLNYTGAFSDPDPDVWTGTVNFGDGTGDQPLALNPDKTFAFQHVFGSNGTFTITVSVADNHSGVGTAQLTVTVIPAGQGNVNVRFAGGTLSLVGDSLANTLMLDQTASGEIRVTGFGTTLNFQHSPISFHFVRNVVISLGAGNDNLWFNCGTRSLIVPGNLIITGSTGNKSVVETALAGTSLAVAGNLNLSTGSGNESVNFTNLLVAGNALFRHTGTGDTNTSLTALGAGQASLIAGLLSIVNGAGFDQLTLANVNLGRANINDGSGNLSTGLGSLTNLNNLNVGGGGFALNAGSSGREVVNLQTATGQSLFSGPVSVTFGAGNDALNLGTGGLVKFFSSALFDGGLGTNVLTKLDGNLWFAIPPLFQHWS